MSVTLFSARAPSPPPRLLRLIERRARLECAQTIIARWGPISAPPALLRLGLSQQLAAELVTPGALDGQRLSLALQSLDAEIKQLRRSRKKRDSGVYHLPENSVPLTQGCDKIENSLPSGNERVTNTV